MSEKSNGEISMISRSFGEIDDFLVVELASYLGVHDAALLLVELQLLMVHSNGC